MRIERSVNANGEAVFTATIPIPEGVDPDWFVEFFERVFSHEIEIVRSGIEAQLDDDGDAGYALPDEFPDDGTQDFSEEDVIT